MLNYLPLIILSILSCIGFGMNIANHSKLEKINAWSNLIGLILSWGLIYWFVIINY